MYWYKKKYAMVDDKHKIYNFRLKKIHTDKITKRRIKNYVITLQNEKKCPG